MLLSRHAHARLAGLSEPPGHADSKAGNFALPDHPKNLALVDLQQLAGLLHRQEFIIGCHRILTCAVLLKLSNDRRPQSRIDVPRKLTGIYRP